MKFGLDPAKFNVAIIELTNTATNTLYKTCEDPISFQFIGPGALVAGLAVGFLAASVPFPRQEHREA